MNESILDLITKQTGQIAILIDPDKVDFSELERTLTLVNDSNIDYLFIGGSTVDKNQFEKVAHFIKNHSNLPLVGFPGDVFQYSSELDALLYLSLLSGRNPSYLIGHHLHTSIEIAQEKFETIPTGYLLIDGGKNSAVAYVSQTTPIPQDQLGIIERTVVAGKLQGKKLMYLDAGSGAKFSVAPIIVERIKSAELPIIVGGGLKTIGQIQSLAEVGANVIVIGNHIEENPEFLKKLSQYKKERSQSLKMGS